MTDKAMDELEATAWRAAMNRAAQMALDRRNFGINNSVNEVLTELATALYQAAKVR